MKYFFFFNKPEYNILPQETKSPPWHKVCEGEYNKSTTTKPEEKEKNNQPIPKQTRGYCHRV